jgi:hypothetical protein
VDAAGITAASGRGGAAAAPSTTLLAHSPPAEERASTIEAAITIPPAICVGPRRSDRTARAKIAPKNGWRFA